MSKKSTIYDLAEMLNFSPGTISRALNDHPGISDKTKRMVRLKAKEIGYRSNRFAVNLSRQKSNTLGVIVPRLDSHFMSTVLSGMETVANKSGYSLIISQSLELQKKEIINSKLLLDSGVDALLVSLAYDTDSYEHFTAFTERNIPLLFFDRVVDMPGCTTILIDNKQAGYEATEHLIEQGCQNILHISGNLKRNVYYERYEGFRKALRANSRRPKKDMLIETGLYPNEIEDIVDQIVNRSGEIDGLFIANDTFAVKVMQELMKAGREIPKQIKVVGFNNDPISEVITPSLTTIAYPGYEMGTLAGQSIINHLVGNFDLQPTDSIILRHKLIVRESSGYDRKNR